MATKKAKDKRKYSWTEFKTLSRRVTPIEDRGFRVWMKLDQKQNLSAHSMKEWDTLFNKFLKS